MGRTVCVYCIYFKKSCPSLDGKTWGHCSNSHSNRYDEKKSIAIDGGVTACVEFEMALDRHAAICKNCYYYVNTEDPNKGMCWAKTPKFTKQRTEPVPAGQQSCAFFAAWD